MSYSYLEKLPSPVTLERLRVHFRDVYALTDPQVEVMLESSSRSVHQALRDVRLLLEEKGAGAALKPFFHGIKGLLLNMGEMEWADCAREMEKLAGEDCLVDPQGAIASLAFGLEQIRDFSPEE